LGVPVGIVVADFTLSWVATSAAIADWVTWAAVSVISVVDVDVTIVAFPVLVAATVSKFVIVLMCATFMGMSMSVVSIIGKVTVVSVVTVVTATVSPCVHVCAVNAGVTIVFFWAPARALAVVVTVSVISVIVVVIMIVGVVIVVVIVGSVVVMTVVVVVAAAVSNVSVVTNAVSPMIQMSVFSTGLTIT